MVLTCQQCRAKHNITTFPTICPTCDAFAFTDPNPKPKSVAEPTKPKQSSVEQPGSSSDS